LPGNGIWLLVFETIPPHFLINYQNIKGFLSVTDLWRYCFMGQNATQARSEWNSKIDEEIDFDLA